MHIKKTIIYLAVSSVSLFGYFGMNFVASAATGTVNPTDVAPGILNGGCSYDGVGSVQGALSGCKPQGSITATDYTITGGVRAKVTKITNQLLILGSLLSVGAIVLAAILYISAIGDGEKVKKAKSTLKFAIIGFAIMLLSFPIVNALINLIYGIEK